MKFELVQELFGHTADVRCACFLLLNGSSNEVAIVTGSRDRSLRIWQQDAATLQYSQTLANYEDHPHWVNCLEALPTGSGLALASGCHDKIIRLFDANLQLIASLGGHTGPVSSLSVLDPSTLISGSWDGSARVWDLTTKQCKTVLDGQENSVAVLGLDNTHVLCGSAGRAQGNVIVDSTLRVFDTNGKLVQASKPHDGPIRCVAAAMRGSGFKFLTASNDGSVILFGENAKPAQRMVNPPGFEGGPAFVFCATAGVSGKVITACDDCCVRVWDAEREFEVEQELEHPSTVWWVLALPNGELVTTSGDGTVRIFSQTRQSADGGQLNAEFQATASAARQAQRNKVAPAMDVSKLVRIEDAPVDQVKDQHVQVFNKNGTAVAYQFTEGAWVEIGQVMSSGGDKEELDGELFDKVVPVEIADEVNGGVKRLKIGFNYTDNPFVVANAFIKDNQLPDFYQDQIVDFIKQNTPQNAQAAATAAAPPPPPVKRCFPLAAAILFDQGANAPKAVQKLKDTLIPLQLLSTNDASELDKILEILNATSRYHATFFTPAQITLVCDRLCAGYGGKMDLNDRFPAYDLLRAMLLHPSAAEELAKRARNNAGMVFTEACIAAAAPGANNALVLCALRAGCNLFRNASATNQVLLACSDASTSPIELLAQRAASGSSLNANSQLALASLMANIASAVYHKQARGDRDRAVLAQCNRVAMHLLPLAGDSAEMMLRLVQALGTIALVDRAVLDADKLRAFPAPRVLSKEWNELLGVI